MANCPFLTQIQFDLEGLLTLRSVIGAASYK